MRIGIYGGSFNPVHRGHMRVAELALGELALDRLLVIPAAVSPFKADARREELASDRVLLLRAAFNGWEKVTVDTREIDRGGVSYAIDTVREVRAENPGAEIFFVIGEDSVAGLPRWKDWETLRTLCEFKAYPRTAESSTEVRARLARGEPVEELVPEPVALFLRHGVGLNPDGKLVRAVREGLSRKGGHCPCRLPRTPEFFCPCAEFRGQLADESFHGLCHCRLYLKP